MLSIFKKKYRGKVDLSEVGKDMHSHLLPGIDDGAGDTDTSLKLIKGLQELGYRRFISTPHVLGDVYKNDAGTINDALQQVQRNLQEPEIISAAAEYYLDDHFDQLLENNTPLLPIKDKWVLVEFSFVTPPMNYKEKIFDLQIKGYQPVLAHPERYNYFMRDKNVYKELKDAGCFLQLNVLSLAGYYGKQALELANYLIKNNFIDLLGTDLHHERHLKVLRSATNIMHPVKMLLDSGKLLNASL